MSSHPLGVSSCKHSRAAPGGPAVDGFAATAGSLYSALRRGRKTPCRAVQAMACFSRLSDPASRRPRAATTHETIPLPNRSPPPRPVLATRAGRLAALLLLLAWGVPGGEARAHHLLDRYALRCDATFPCPPALQRRVDLWIEVFSRYGDGQVILHDSDRPERIYKVLKSKARCSRRREPRRIRRARRAIAASLRRIARQRAAGRPVAPRDRHLALLFKGEGPAVIRRAARRIRCQDGNRDRFAQALERYGLYRDAVVAALRQAGLPEDIQYLPFVESGYNPRAYSRVGAAGMWQIMPRTARKLGLQLGGAVDERLDPDAATRAAIRYLQRSHEILSATAGGRAGDTSLYPFVITSYNYGVAGMRRALRHMGPDFVKVIHHYRARRFRVAVKNFYASFLAARHVARNAGKYFPGVRMQRPPRRFRWVVARPTSARRLSRVLEVPLATLKALNPSLTRFVWSGQRLVPRGYVLHLPERQDAYRTRIAALQALPPERPRLADGHYRVQPGDTACGIARRHRVSCRELIALNGLGRRALIRAGQILVLPTAAGGRRAAVAAAPRPRPPRPATVPAAVAAPKRPQRDIRPEEVARAFGIGGDLFVRRGLPGDPAAHWIRVEPEETLGHYADWLGLAGTRGLRRLNRLRPGQGIVIGRRLKLPVRDAPQKARFERRRIEFHRTLESEFLEHYRITGQEDHRVRRGDSPWTIARRAEIPLWLLRRFNPDLLVSPPRPGAIVRLPVIEPR